MSNWKDKTNNEILLAIKQMQADHEAIKIKMLKEYSILEAIESEFNEANNELHERLTGK